MPSIRRCSDGEREAIFAIVNAAAEAYRGVIPADRWHEPYMPMEELDGEIAAGVEFWGYEEDGELLGIMGIQPLGEVDLIRHAYVLPASQGKGVGGALHRASAPLRHPPHAGRHLGRRRVGDPLLSRPRLRAGLPERKDELLRTYWDIPERQIETSVVLANPPFEEP